MNTRNTGLRGQGCDCAGYWFRHRQGSKYCWYRKDGTMRAPGDTDFNDRDLSDEDIVAIAAQTKERQ